MRTRRVRILMQASIVTIALATAFAHAAHAGFLSEVKKLRKGLDDAKKATAVVEETSKDVGAIIDSTAVIVDLFIPAADSLAPGSIAPVPAAATPQESTGARVDSGASARGDEVVAEPTTDDAADVDTETDDVLLDDEEGEITDDDEFFDEAGDDASEQDGDDEEEDEDDEDA